MSQFNGLSNSHKKYRYVIILLKRIYANEIVIKTSGLI